VELLKAPFLILEALQLRTSQICKPVFTHDTFCMLQKLYHHQTLKSYSDAV